MVGAIKNQAGRRRSLALLGLFIGLVLCGCAGPVRSVQVSGLEGPFVAGDIISAATGGRVDFHVMLADLSNAQVVYVGETHSNPAHHAIQLRIIEALHHIYPDLIVGMEMFDHTYQEVLDDWSDGRMEEEVFLKKTHWYVNWRYDFGLYREILQFVKAAGIRLVALNIPFHIPPKIAAGGVENLGAEDRGHLPDKIDMSNPDHRAYVEKIFNRHHMRAGGDFETFYQAQCAWEDAMAEAVAAESRQAPMVVLAGNGHIIRKFGIPNRVYTRTGAPFRTLYPVSAGGEAALDLADYLWITP